MGKTSEAAVYRKYINSMKKKTKKMNEEKMTPAQKRKDTMLKKKYDDSDMKKNMQDQYGKEEGKKVYFATIRKQAMEGVAAIPTAVNIGSKVLPAAAATIGAVGTFLQARKAGKFTRKVMKGKVGDQQKIK